MKYTVFVTQTITKTTSVQVDAADEDEAVQKAQDASMSMLDCEWNTAEDPCGLRYEVTSDCEQS